ncbi:MAG: hypothetical protein ABSA54_01885 [Terriglobales bacterium]
MGSSWAWAHGRAGAIATAGVIIASAVGEEEGTSPAVETAVDVLMQPIVDVGHRQEALGAAAGPAVVPPYVAPKPQQRVVARPMVLPIPQQRVVARPMVAAVVDRMVARPMVAVADRMAANTTRW